MSMFGCATNSTRIRLLKDQYPECTVGDNAELICPVPFTEDDTVVKETVRLIKSKK